MAYNKTTWENGVTPVNATNMNKIEDGIYNNSINIGENRTSTITVTGTVSNATVTFKRCGKTVQLTATMTAPANQTNTQVLSFVEEDMPSWAKISESSSQVYLINQTKISSLSAGSNSILIDKVTNIQFIKETTNKYTFKLNIFKSSSETSAFTDTITACYVTDIN